MWKGAAMLLMTHIFINTPALLQSHWIWCKRLCVQDQVSRPHPALKGHSYCACQGIWTLSSSLICLLLCSPFVTSLSSLSPPSPYLLLHLYVPISVPQVDIETDTNYRWKEKEAVMKLFISQHSLILLGLGLCQVARGQWGIITCPKIIQAHWVNSQALSGGLEK